MLTGRVLGRLAALGGLGVLLAVMGTGIHRARPPLGLALALLLVLCAAVLARGWSGWAGMLALGLGLVTTVGILGAQGPGGDVLIAAQPLGYAWYAGGLLVALAGLVPRRWFSDRPIGGQQG